MKLFEIAEEKWPIFVVLVYDQWAKLGKESNLVDIRDHGMEGVDMSTFDGEREDLLMRLHQKMGGSFIDGRVIYDSSRVFAVLTSFGDTKNKGDGFTVIQAIVRRKVNQSLIDKFRQLCDAERT